MRKIINGVCPVQGKEYSISIDYVDASTLAKKEYIKGRAYCDYNKFGGKCNPSICPLYNSAPDKL